LGFVFDYRNAQRYEDWYQRREGREALKLERDLIERFLESRPGERLLDIGCGTGMHLSWFQDLMLHITGLDASPYMLDRARRRLDSGADLHRGRAEDLPFEDNEFDLSTMLNTLEFVEDPQRAVAEAIRVTRRRIVLGVLNKYALMSMHRRLKGLLVDTIYRHARFFSVWQLKELVQNVIGPSPIRWGTVLFFPLRLVQVTRVVEGHSLFQQNPCGAFIVMRVDLCYRFIACSDPLTNRLQQRQGQLPQGTLRAFFRPPEWKSEHPPGPMPSA
jgi:ubiquinone/menaquinone biosynthesis C-methylase UbiE